MKKVTALIILGLFTITFCMIYLVFSGVSLRSAALIQPSVISANYRNVAVGLVHRLFHELQDADYVLWGVLPETHDSQIILKLAIEEYEKIFHQTVNILPDAENASNEQLKACSKPCWLLIPYMKAHQLEKNSFIENKILPLKRVFFTLTIVPFNQNEIVIKECETQKRLNFDCLVSVSIREVRRKMKQAHTRYFFLRKYDENDFFLFIQRAISS